MATRRPPPADRRAVFVSLVVAVLAVAGMIGWRLHGHTASAGAAPPTTTTAAPTSTSSTTTTLSAASLPQTHTLPPPVTRGLTRRIRALLDAVSSDDVHVGIAAFFPVQAYVQTKIYWDAAHDWRTRLIPEYANDIHALHRQLDPSGAPMRLLGYQVDDAAAVWVLPGEEFNKGPYWRVYDTVVSYAIGSRQGSLTVNTLISWRGEWYVAHVANFNS